MSNQSADLFLEACGAGGPWHLSAEGPDRQGTDVEAFPLPFAVIGRDPQADLVLRDAEVSRRHAYLQVLAGRLFCVDLQSRTGTHWETGPEESGWLEDGQGVRVGPYGLRRADGGGVPAAEDFHPLASRPPEPQHLPDVTLEFIEGPAQFTTWRMNRVLTLVGRAQNCKVKLYDPSVSNIHCSLLRTPVGVWAIDLLGRDGIAVNGTGVRWSRLDDGDELRVGKFVIRVRYQSAASVGLPPLASMAPPRPPAGSGSPLLPAVVPGHGGPLLPASQSSDPTASLLMPLVNQFALMQQQMFDQFQQTVMMMVQMFGSMHKEQMGLIREEMARVDELTRELHALQAELARRPQERPAESPPEVEEDRAAPAVNPSAGSAADRPVPQEPAAPAAAAPPTETAVNGHPAEQAAPSSPAAAAGPLGSAAGPGQGTPMPPEQPVPDTPPAGGGAVADVHVWLHQRIAEIQKERQSRFQRILNYVLGK